MDYERPESFGERFGFIEKPKLQYHELNSVTRTDLFNTIHLILDLPYKVVQGKAQYELKAALAELRKNVWTRIFNENVLDFRNVDINDDIRQIFSRSKFYEVFGFIEKLIVLLPEEYFPDDVVIDLLNRCLIRNTVAWRIN